MAPARQIALSDANGQLQGLILASEASITMALSGATHINQPLTADAQPQIASHG